MKNEGITKADEIKWDFGQIVADFYWKTIAPMKTVHFSSLSTVTRNTLLMFLWRQQIKTKVSKEWILLKLKTTFANEEWKDEKWLKIRMQFKKTTTQHCFYVFVFYLFFLIEMYCKVIICHSSHYMAWCTRSTTPIYRRNTRKHTQGFTMGKQEV